MSFLKNKVFMITIITAVILGLTTGCGASPEGNGGTSADTQALQDQISELQADLKTSQGKAKSLQAELEAAQGKVSDLQQQIITLSAESELSGETPAETAAKIIKQYHETHTYSRKDLFVCADMSKEVWNMLQAQGIEAYIQIGSVESVVKNMEDSGHAWVLAEISPGNLLALETTSGQVVQRNENALYYEGWSFENPYEYKRFEELKYEHNVRLGILTELVEEYNSLNTEYDRAFNTYQTMLDEYNATYLGKPTSDESENAYDEMSAQLNVVKEIEGRQNQLEILIALQRQDLAAIVPQMQALVN